MQKPHIFGLYWQNAFEIKNTYLLNPWWTNEQMNESTTEWMNSCDDDERKHCCVNFQWYLTKHFMELLEIEWGDETIWSTFNDMENISTKIILVGKSKKGSN